MWSLFSCILVCVSLSRGQVAPYGPTTLPLASPTPSASFNPAIPTTIPSVAPTPFPFAPTPRPLLPGVPGYNPYYNHISGPAVPILTYSNDHIGDGSYSYSFTTADGKQAQENGFLKDAYIDNAGEPQGTQVVQGSYAYVAPDGTPVQVSYVADENGFRPSGVHIPADGKGLSPLPAITDVRRDNKIIDPFNRYNPYNYRNGLNRPFDRRYPYQQPFDTRYPYQQPYDSRYPHQQHYDQKYPYDPARYNPFSQPFGYNKDAKDQKRV